MHTSVNNLANFVISLFLWILISIFIVPLVFLLFIYKSFVIFLAYRVDKHLHPTHANDTYFSVGDIKQVPIVNVAQIWRIEGYVELDDFKQLFQNLFLNCPNSRKNYLNLYCYLQQFGGYIFKKSVEHIDIDQHVKVRQITGTLEQFVVKYMLEEPFVEGRPLWEIALVYLPADNKPLSCGNANQNENVGETVILLKIHHCLIDGYGFIHMVEKFTGNEAPYLVEDEKETLLQKLKASFFGPKTLLDYAIRVAKTPDLFYPLKDRHNAQWYASLNTLNLSKLKGVRRQTKAHFISLMMSLTIGALRRYLVETAKNSKNQISIPSHIWTANSLPWPNHPRTTLVNHWSGGVFQVPFQTGDALERVYGTEQFFRFFHNAQMHKTVKRLIIPVTWCLPSIVLRWGHSLDLYYFRYSNAFASLLLSDKPHYLLGKKVKSLYMPLGIKDAVSTSVLFGVSSSHSGQLDMSLLANSELVPDQAALDKIANVYFAQELEQLCRAVDGRVISILEVSPSEDELNKAEVSNKIIDSDISINCTGNNMQKG